MTPNVHPAAFLLRQRGAATLRQPIQARRIVSRGLISFADLAQASRTSIAKGERAVGGFGLLIVFLVSVVVGQTISVGLGILVERHATPYAGLMTFIFCYFATFWLAWRLAVRVTEPRTRGRVSAKPSAVLFAYATADELWIQSASLL